VTVSDTWVLWACDGPIPTEESEPRYEWITFEYFISDAELKQLWASDGERAIDAWIREHGGGTRPANFWRYALPYAGERRHGAKLASPFLEGETQGQYLKRHGLLLKSERGA
jgi:hypothetical protein